MATSRICTTLCAVLVLTASPAFAGSPCTDPPIPRLGELAAEPAIVRMTPRQIKLTCDAYNAFSHIFACADEVTNTIYLTDETYLRNLGWSATDIACLEKHERAHLWHVDGTRWPGNHRGRVSR